MKIITVQELEQNPGLYDEVAEVLRNNGSVCFPTATTYRLAANILSEKAVINFLQVKRRTRKAPLLVFVPDADKLSLVAESVPDSVAPLIQTFWPGPLTLLFELSKSLPRKVLKNLKGNGKVGVRIPDGTIAQNVLRAFDGPLLISSANLPKKAGSYSEARIKKDFAPWIDLMISAGDLNDSFKSTVLDVTVEPPVIQRPGKIELEEVMACL